MAAWNNATRRCGGGQVTNRVFINRLREVLGYDDLYPQGYRTEEERFFQPPPSTDGRVPVRVAT